MWRLSPILATTTNFKVSKQNIYIAHYAMPLMHSANNHTIHTNEYTHTLFSEMPIPEKNLHHQVDASSIFTTPPGNLGT